MLRLVDRARSPANPRLTIQVSTSLDPRALLDLCKAVEASLGRDFSTFRNGPRVIDLDVLLFDDVVLDTREGAATSSEGKEEERWLKVPHAGIQEREFVLRPLAECAALFPRCCFYSLPRPR